MADKIKNHAEHLGWELGVDFPLWANTEVYVKTISAGYLFGDEKPKDAYWRVSTTVARRLGKPELASKFFDYIWNCLLYTSPSPRDGLLSRMPSSA